MAAHLRAPALAAVAAPPRSTPTTGILHAAVMASLFCAIVVAWGCSEATVANADTTSADDTLQAVSDGSVANDGVADDVDAADGDVGADSATKADDALTDGAATDDAVVDDVVADDAGTTGTGGTGGTGDSTNGDDAGDATTPPCDPSAGKTEICNGVDDDCDGQTDEGAQICDDGNVCTIDEACAPSGGGWACVGTPVDGPCDDNNICTGGEACSGGVCTGGFVSACNDMNECTTDSCDSSGAGCTHEPISGCGLPCTMGKGDCPKPNFCDSQVPLTCSGAGRCTLKPDTCTGEVKPVCGCDNTTYSNACLAAQAGVPVQSTGACPK